jgi:hypothetical protein
MNQSNARKERRQSSEYEAMIRVGSVKNRTTTKLSLQLESSLLESVRNILLANVLQNQPKMNPKLKMMSNPIQLEYHPIQFPEKPKHQFDSMK